MFHYLTPDKIFDFLRKKRYDFFKEEELRVENTSTLDDSYINDFSKNENSVKLLFDVSATKFLSVSSNVQSISGYSEAEILKGNMSLILKVLTLEHFLFPYNWGKWITDIYNKTGNLDGLRITICGVKMKHKQGNTLSGLIQYAPVDILNNTEDGVSKTATMAITEISHLVKSDFYWMRAEFGLNEKQTHYFSSQYYKSYPYDIISDREKDVLKLIIEGMESKEIGEVLFISSHTVDNHRRNMISRTGARDSTALIHICKMGGII
jgi:DNA-binding CsgD family transcriptional regulator